MFEKSVSFSLTYSVLFVLWFFEIWPISIPSSQSVLFFAIGAYFSLTQQDLFFCDEHGILIGLLYFIFIVSDALLFGTKLTITPFVHKIGIVLGVPTALFLTKSIAKTKRTKSLILWLSSASFFVFAVHEPLLTILKKIVYRIVMPHSSTLVLAIYFIVPLIVIVVAIFAYRYLMSIAPKLLGVVTGGRSF